MFSKLLKHEWKANAGLLGILSLCALGVGLLGGGVLRAITQLEQKMIGNQLASVAISGLSSMMVFVVIALIAYALAVQFITVFRFYKNKFTDEGYLTFTLPVTAHQIFWSSFLNILAWLVISLVVVLLSILLIISLGLDAPSRLFFQEMRDLISSSDEWEFTLPGTGLLLALGGLQVIITPFYSIILLMTSITLGCVLAKKHKILATIGMYYCINMAVNVVETGLGIAPTLLLLSASLTESENYLYYVSLSMGLTLLLQIGLAIGGYFWSTHLMKHKLNLP
jgi:hypothetical protein